MPVDAELDRLKRVVDTTFRLKQTAYLALTKARVARQNANKSLQAAFAAKRVAHQACVASSRKYSRASFESSVEAREFQSAKRAHDEAKQRQDRAQQVFNRATQDHQVAVQEFAALRTALSGADGR